MPVYGRSVLICFVILAVGAARAGAAPPVSEFPLPDPDRAPLGIAAAPNGTLMFAEGATDHIGISTLAGAITDDSGALSGPTLGVAAAGGYVWMTEPGAGRIARVAPSGTVVEFTVPGNGSPHAITAGPDGNAWFTDTAGSDRIGRITPAGSITEFSSGLTANSDPSAITAGPDGNLWFTESANPGRIGRITPAGSITEFSSGLTANSDPSAITPGPGGDLWFTESANPGGIGWISPQGAIAQVPTPSAGSLPFGIAEGADGDVWFTELGDHGKLGRLALPLPQPVTGQPTAITTTSATLTGTVDPGGFPATYDFEWGPTAAYGQQAPAAAAPAGSADAPQAVTQVLSGLTPGTTYHLRLVASDCDGCASGTADGADVTFTTAALPAVVSTPPVATTPVPPPAAPAPAAIGKTAVASVVAGTVLVRVPGSARLQSLVADRDIPIGSLIDARRGRIALTTEIDRHGRMQTATAWGAEFALGQTVRRGMTTFALRGGPSCPTPAAARGERALAARAHHVAARRKPVTLWAHDHNGRYSTQGNNSVATVRGTWWRTTDSCRGTLTFVKQGVVAVRDLHTHRTVLVHAGHRYLARPAPRTGR
jgi:streptogramin lyase